MAATRRFHLTNLVLAGLALGHASLTWPWRATVALFVGGAITDDGDPAPEATAARAGRRDREREELSVESAAELFGER